MGISNEGDPTARFAVAAAQSHARNARIAYNLGDAKTRRGHVQDTFDRITDFMRLQNIDPHRVRFVPPEWHRLSEDDNST